jgi:Carboxypeptidase regulatory-like domain
MTQGWVTMAAVVSITFNTALGASAQGSSTAPISGVVVDSSGGVVPGADVLVRNNGTAETFAAVTSGQGVFSVPSLITGTYTVTVSLQGFKTAVVNNVVVNAGVPASVRAVLELGGVAEQVVVQSNAELVQTQSATISTTLDTRQVMNLPLSSRNAGDFITFLTGVQTAAGSRDSIVSGLPQSTINMTLDGVNIQDNTNKTTDGFFAIVGPRIDAVEEITFTTVAGGADSSGMGATQIRYVTKSGTNQFRGSVFHTYRSDALNANTWFNKRDGLPKPQLLLNQPGFNLGGPILLPGFNGRSKAFFFVHYEESRSPGSTRRTRQIFSPAAQQGIFRYNTAQGVREVNLFALAAANGQTSTPDPIIARLLADIRAATESGGSRREMTDPLFQEFSYELPTSSKNHYPTLRMDYQVTDRHRLTYSMNFQYIGGGPDTTNNREAYFPGFPVVSNQGSTRRQASAWLRSMLRPNLVNELRLGYGGAPVVFWTELKPEMWSGTVANQGGFYLNMNNVLPGPTAQTGLTNAGSNATNQSRDAYARSIENTLNWQAGSHTINLGGSFMQFDLWMENQQIVPELRFGVVQGDPADGMFNTTNFPGASTANLTAARAHYAILTGRVSEVRGVARLNEQTGQYEYLGRSVQRARQREFGFWAQDSWRMHPNFSLNYGLRYELQLPFVASNNGYSIGTVEDVFGVSGAGNIFKPGVLQGRPPEFHQLRQGERPYAMDWNNVAPSVGFAWTPSARGGWTGPLIGRTGDLVVRAGYSRAYTRLGLASFTTPIGNNPGVAINVYRQLALGNLGALPLLMRDTNRLGAADFNRTPVFPFRDVVTGDITIFSPGLKVPYADTWQTGVTRAVGRTMSVEARYVGARSAGNWRTNNYNELNIKENGFFDEFKLAMTNLQANIAAGRGATFAYAGPGTGTAPLPIFLAYFNGVPANQAGNPALYTSANFRSTTFVNPLARYNPNPYAAVDALDADAASRARALNAGLPANFLLANPDLLTGANIVENTTKTMYNSMALELRRRSSTGLGFQTSYVLGHATESRFLSLRVDSPMVRNAGAEGDVTHAFKANVVYPLPFGREQRFGRSAGAGLDRLLGGWLLAGNARVQTGRLLDFGNVRLVGMTRDELARMFKTRVDSTGRVWMLPQDIIDESVKAFNASATSATGWGPQGAPSGRYIAPADGLGCIEPIRGLGECGLQSVVVTGPLYRQYDFSLVKRVALWGQVNAEFHIDVLNAFNNVNFAPVSGMSEVPMDSNRQDGSNPDTYAVTELTTGVNMARVVQLVARIRW